MRSFDGTTWPDAADVAAAVKTAIVTGAGGFIGRALLARLDARGCRVRGFDLPGRAAGDAIRCADLSHPGITQTSIAAAADDLGTAATVFHLAGFANASVCRADPPGAFAANVTAPANVLEPSRFAPLSPILFPSTSLVYPSPVRP